LGSPASARSNMVGRRSKISTRAEHARSAVLPSPLAACSHSSTCCAATPGGGSISRPCISLEGHSHDLCVCLGLNRGRSTQKVSSSSRIWCHRSQPAQLYVEQVLFNSCCWYHVVEITVHALMTLLVITGREIAPLCCTQSTDTRTLQRSLDKQIICAANGSQAPLSC